MYLAKLRDFCQRRVILQLQRKGTDITLPQTQNRVKFCIVISTDDSAKILHHQDLEVKKNL